MDYGITNILLIDPYYNYHPLGGESFNQLFLYNSPPLMDNFKGGGGNCNL